ncbi:MAG TPA: hypothetical protein ENI95_13365 [Chloroflexi bacterium]|nr:hypothetical protein [Chloroflexota bacterium]
MPVLARWFVKSALVYFVLALVAGVLSAAGPVLDLPLRIPALGPVYFHLLMVGWVTQLIIGMAYWMFPKYSKERPRGSDALAWATYILLNAGLILRVIGEPLTAASPGSGWGWLLAASATLQLLAGWAFIANTWRRVRER